MNFKKRRHIDCWNHDWKDKKKKENTAVRELSFF